MILAYSHSNRGKMLLCALADKKLDYFRRGHFHRALEEAVHAHSNQWPTLWQGKNPLHGANNFTKMSPVERVSCTCFINIIQAHNADHRIASLPC